MLSSHPYTSGPAYREPAGFPSSHSTPPPTCCRLVLRLLPRVPPLVVALLLLLFPRSPMTHHPTAGVGFRKDAQVPGLYPKFKENRFIAMYI